ncbi:PAS domain-containing protein [Pelagibius sp. Alg239-R121]|uniref:PAS domain-containing protein n=1 Tax=Pelagibius sp. Alg239-R121 TaxID=2993448 RepID=UPI0024A71EEF|nr:PAS domain-containing protein [Pelagibius sp. Alg239-R121]
MCEGDDIWSRLRSPLHQEAYRYWRSKFSEGLLPGRDAIDPLEVPSVLPWLNLVDVLKDGDQYRFRHRLIGTGIVGRYGRDATGSWFDDVYEPELLGEHLHDYVELVTTARPNLSQVAMPIPEKNFISYQRLALPLATDGSNIDMIMVVIDFDDHGAA